MKHIGTVPFALTSLLNIGNRQSKMFWGHSLNENNHREVAKADASYMPRARNGSSMQACSASRGALHRANRWR